MSKLINRKTPKQFFIGDRDILRDTRISSASKSLYYVLSSLAESCENVCPSHSWLAKEIGYNSEGKEARTIHKFVSSKLNELVAIKAIKIIKNIGYTNDYEIYDYPVLGSVPKSTGGLYQKVQGTPDKKVQGGVYQKVHIEIREEKEEEKNKDIIINKNEKLKKLKEINIQALEEYRLIILNQPINKEVYKDNKRWVNFTEFSVEQAKIDLNIIIETMKNWIEKIEVKDIRKLSDKPKIADTFKTFVLGKNIGWRKPDLFKKSIGFKEVVSNASIYSDNQKDEIKQVTYMLEDLSNQDIDILTDKTKKAQKDGYETHFMPNLLQFLKEKYGYHAIIQKLPITEFLLNELTN